MLLTGAGFTKNFGAPLAKELWGIILGSPILDTAPDVRRALLHDFDFESVYNNVMRGEKLPVDDETDWNIQKQALGKAVKEAYEDIDAKIRGFRFGKDSPYPVDISRVQDFIASFSGNSKKPGFFFTLNQDLFVERQYYSGQRPTLPGIKHRLNWFTGDNTHSLDADRVVIPEDQTAGSALLDGSPFYYLKLHGSSNWYTSDEQTMVIGDAKQDQIAAQPILAAYFDHFKSVLESGSRRLLCVGYSFADSHINTAIALGIRAGLSLYVLSPEPPDNLAHRLRGTETGDRLWQGLAGYFQCDLKTLFPADQSDTAEWRMVQRQFFGNA
jgi:hypothetical protein